MTGYPFRFDLRKSLQAVGVLLGEEHGKRMNHMRLLKLVYIADREALKESHRPITGNRPIAMKRGPLPEETYQLIRAQHPAFRQCVPGRESVGARQRNSRNYGEKIPAWALLYFDASRNETRRLDVEPNREAARNVAARFASAIGAIDAKPGMTGSQQSGSRTAVHEAARQGRARKGGSDPVSAEGSGQVGARGRLSPAPSPAEGAE